MADSSSSSAPAAATGGTGKPQAAPRPPNPVFKMMGMPNIRFKLPSRNWMIFFTITGSFAGALIYDRREKRRAQKKWCELVAHLADEPLAVEQMRRKLTVYLAAPPGDGLRVARDHFKEYVKPILTAAALDYTVIEGRREGDVRVGTAESIRKLRRKAGESSATVEEPTVDSAVAEMRERIGIHDEPGPKGDIVIGRHTWKEYIRGLHEGWLGPLDPPTPSPGPSSEPSPAPEAATPETSKPQVEITAAESLEETMKDVAAGDQPSEEQASTEKTPEDEKKRKKRSPQSLPSFDSSVPIEFPHLLGFLNTPIRIYRYLNQRHVAENVGREVAGLVLASSSRSYRNESFSQDSELSGVTVDLTPSSDDGSFTDVARGNLEQQTILENAEKEWHKSVYKRDDEDKEREWLDDVILDPRIASRMQLSILSPEDEARAQRIGEENEYILGRERPVPVAFWQRMWIKYGYGEDEETLKKKPILGNIDSEDSS
ncbi:Mitochondrial import inner membrane translocase subunit Tim54 [Penicillium macrosclerotiorum]|uniref:Mitochondrial import inner membrane translocase subunit Tim54 n=1 Tax=Penicillium macrosclerotiorum TaxID=303699 RepID=UPI002546CE22|nr:Mitochondrial import inner membrane translocase subunit Tim54 [Penicillium macrosclerotiorum]KAJ5679456.1 Mitochondrial import inner membrane translocase subunit Tim54 [Penicillium macrosclerotiorum]